MKIIDALHLAFDYVRTDENDKVVEKTRALDDMSVQIEEGSFVCILGHNGSGKSTFAKLINGLNLPSEGTILVSGKDTKNEQEIWDIRKSTGMVFQNPDNQIIGSIVDEEVAFGLENIGASTRDIRKGVYKALEEVDMREYAKVSPNRLSGGQKQRVAVAGVLAMNPKCIVLDESTAMLDPRGRKEVMDTVKKLNKNDGITIISITHYMEEALEADYIFVMEQGHLKMQGTPKEIFSREEEVEQLGLKLPQLCQLARSLREGGMDIPLGITSEEELKEAIAACNKK